MLPCNQKKAYLDAVCAQVRWKQAHETIRRELGDHIDDQAAAFEADGTAAEDAAARAVTEMGDPADIGLELDASYRPRQQTTMLVLLGALVGLGALCRALLLDANTGWWLGFATALLIGGGCFALFYNLNLYRLVKWLPYLLGAVLLWAGAACLMIRVKGYESWYFTLGFANYARYLTPVFPALLAGLAYHLQGRGVGGLLLCGAATAFMALCLSSTPSYACALELMLSCLAVLTAAIFAGVFGKRRALPLCLTYFGVAGAGSCFLLASPYRAWRVVGLFRGEAWYPNTLRQILASAQLFGAGPDTPDSLRAGFSSSAVGQVSTANDFMLTTVIHRYGWVAAAVLLLALAAFLAYGFFRAHRLTSQCGRLLALALLSGFAAQMLGYFMINMGLILGGPLPMPFLSPGNVAFVVNLAMAGLLLSLFRTDGLCADSAPGRAKRLKVRVEWV